MEDVEKSGVWIPTVDVCRNERSGNYTLIRYGAVEDCGMSFVLGEVILVSAEDMAKTALSKIVDALAFYQVWPAGTKFGSEIAAMDSRLRSKFIRDHRFVQVFKRDQYSLCLSPKHRVGGGWRGITGSIWEEIEVKRNISSERFFGVLTRAFELAT